MYLHYLQWLIVNGGDTYTVACQIKVVEYNKRGLFSEKKIMTKGVVQDVFSVVFLTIMKILEPFYPLVAIILILLKSGVFPAMILRYYRNLI